MKDYSHIKRGMYVLISELGSNRVAVEEAFVQSPDFYMSPNNYLEYEEDEDMLGVNDHGEVGTWCEDHGLFENPKQVSIDFILNGPEKEEDAPTHPYQVGTKWMCGEFEVLIVHLDKNLEEVHPWAVGYCEELTMAGCFSASGVWRSNNSELLMSNLTPIKTPLQIELEKAKLSLEEAKQVVLNLESKIKQQEEI